MEISEVTMRKIVQVYAGRVVETKKIEKYDSEQFVLASEMLEQYEKSKTADAESVLLNFLYRRLALDADCATMFFLFQCEKAQISFGQLVVLGVEVLQTSLRLRNVSAEIATINQLIRLVIDVAKHDKDNAVSGVCAYNMVDAVFPKLRHIFTGEEMYDMLSLYAHAIELKLKSNPTNQTLLWTEISVRQEARAIAKKLFPFNYCMECRLLVLLIGSDIGSQETHELAYKTRCRVQPIVEDLEPLKILNWIDSSKTVNDKDVADTLCYIALTIIHGYVPNRTAEFGLKILQRATEAGASDEIVALWL